MCTAMKVPLKKADTSLLEDIGFDVKKTTKVFQYMSRFREESEGLVATAPTSSSDTNNNDDETEELAVVLFNISLMKQDQSHVQEINDNQTYQWATF